MTRTFCIPIKALKDNYIWILGREKKIIVIDPGDAEPIINLLKECHYEIQGILLTHHHTDHIGGVQKLRNYSKKFFPVYGPKENLSNLIDQEAKEENTITIEKIRVSLIVMKTPGHTLDHVCYYQKKENGNPPRLFCGDTLFSCGCGRLFEGKPYQMFKSLKRISKLPSDTLIYCGHEYTLNNIQFAKYIDPYNQMLVLHELNMKKHLANGLPTIPSSLEIEKKINPFLRTGFLKRLNKIKKMKSNASEEDYFMILRKLKDDFNPTSV